MTKTESSARIATIVGYFDPILNSDVEIIVRGLTLFDRIIVGVATNQDHEHTFSLDKRIELVHACFKQECHEPTWYSRLSQVEVLPVDGLPTEFAKQVGAKVILATIGHAARKDDLMLAQAYRRLAPDVETVYLFSHNDCSLVSDSLVVELAKLRGDVTKFVHKPVAIALSERFGSGV